VASASGEVDSTITRRATESVIVELETAAEHAYREAHDRNRRADAGGEHEATFRAAGAEAHARGLAYERAARALKASLVAPMGLATARGAAPEDESAQRRGGAGGRAA
jgi:hypothetical protein